MTDGQFNIIDSLFRKAAEKNTSLPPDSAWQKMNALLDEDDKKRKLIPGIWFLPLIITLSCLVMFLIIGPEKILYPGSYASDNFLTKKRAGSITKTDSLIDSDAIITILSITNSANEKENIINRKSGNPDNIAAADKQNIDHEINDHAIVLAKAFPISVHPIHDSILNNKELRLNLSDFENAESEKKSRAPRESKWYISGVASAEKSFVPGGLNSRVSTAYGFGLGYSFSKKWSVQAGILKSTKIYDAPGNAYKPRSGSYYDNSNIKINSVSANCVVYEIPLQIKYSMLRSRTNSLNISAGLVSTVMDKENYSYDYVRYGIPANSNYSYSSGSFKLFSNALLSVGYEHKILPVLSISASPFYNLPLKGIGEGSIKLHSAGILFGLRYQLERN